MLENDPRSSQSTAVTGENERRKINNTNSTFNGELQASNVRSTSQPFQDLHNIQTSVERPSTAMPTTSQRMMHPASLGQTPSPTQPSPSTRKYVPRSYQELSEMKSPDYAKKYISGSLGELGLKVKDFDIVVEKPEMNGREFHPPPEPKYERNEKDQRVRKPSCEEVLYLILTRVPGNRMKTDPLRNMFVEYMGKTRS